MQFIYWIIEGKLAGRPGPTRQEWNPEELHAAGIDSVISLAAEVEVTDLTAYGLEHYRANFPPLVLSSEGLRKAFIYQALPVWSFIDQQLKLDRSTLVHCYAGNDRTGAMLSGYLVIYKGATPEEAISLIRSLNPRAMEAPGYEDAVRLLVPGQQPDPTTLL